MIAVTLEKENDSRSLYIQLYEKIKAQIIGGEIEPESPLPSKRKLAESLGVSLKTVENAYSQLLLEGYIYSQEKKGYYAAYLEGYRNLRLKSHVYVPKFRDTHYRVDLRSNKHDRESFPLSTWNHIMREVMSYNEEVLLNTIPFNGIEELRVAIAGHLLSYRGMQVSPDQIIIGAGTEYLYIRLFQLLGRESVFAVDDPCYRRIKELYRSNGIRYRAIPVDADGIRPELLRESDCNILHISPAHQFPLGYVMPVSRRVELLKWANEQPDRYIIEDDYDSEFRYWGLPVQPLYNIAIRPKVIYMNTFSKSVAPAVRISYMVLPDKLIGQYLKTQSFYTCTVSSFEQYTLARFIERGHFERYVNRMRRLYAEQRETIISAIKNSALSQCSEILEDSSGNHFRLKLRTSIPDEKLIGELKKRDILISCLSEYLERPDPEYDSTLVLNYSGINEEQIRYFIRQLIAVLGTHGT